MAKATQRAETKEIQELFVGELPCKTFSHDSSNVGLCWMTKHQPRLASSHR